MNFLRKSVLRYSHWGKKILYKHLARVNWFHLHLVLLVVIDDFDVFRTAPYFSKMTVPRLRPVRAMSLPSPAV